MDLSTMFDKVSMKAYSNIGIDLRVKFFDFEMYFVHVLVGFYFPRLWCVCDVIIQYDFELMVESYKEFYGTNRSIADLCGKFLGFGITLIQKSM